MFKTNVKERKKEKLQLKLSLQEFLFDRYIYIIVYKLYNYSVEMIKMWVGVSCKRNNAIWQKTNALYRSERNDNTKGTNIYIYSFSNCSTFSDQLWKGYRSGEKGGKQEREKNIHSYKYITHQVSFCSVRWVVGPLSSTKLSSCKCAFIQHHHHHHREYRTRKLGKCQTQRQSIHQWLWESHMSSQKNNCPFSSSFSSDAL